VRRRRAWIREGRRFVEMPATSEKQRKFMGAARKRAGKKTQTGMSEGQLEEFAKGMVKSPPKGRQAGPKKPPTPRPY